MADVQAAKDGILEAIALHAISEGKKADLTALQTEVSEAVSKADTKLKRAVTRAETTRATAVEKATATFSEERDEQTARLSKAEADASAALEDLLTFQRKLREDTGAIIDLTAVPAGGTQVSL